MNATKKTAHVTGIFYLAIFFANFFVFIFVSGSLIFLVGFLISLRFLYYFFTGGGGGHVQSLILAALLLATGFFLGVIGLLADLISVNRRLLERLDWRLQKLDELVRSSRQENG